MRRELQELLADMSWQRDYSIQLAKRSVNREIASLNQGAFLGFREVVDRLQAMVREPDGGHLASGTGFLDE